MRKKGGHGRKTVLARLCRAHRATAGSPLAAWSSQLGTTRAARTEDRRTGWSTRRSRRVQPSVDHRSSRGLRWAIVSHGTPHGQRAPPQRRGWWSWSPSQPARDSSSSAQG